MKKCACNLKACILLIDIDAILPGPPWNGNERNETKETTFIKGSLDEKLPIYEQDPKSKRLDSFEKRFVRD